MHFSTKQKQTHRQSRPVAAKGRRGWGEERVSRHKLVHTASKDMPAAQHRELSSVSCDKSQRKRMWKKCETHTDVKWKSLSHVRLFVIPWTVQPWNSPGYQSGYWSGEPFPSTGDLPNPGSEPRSPASQKDSLPAEPPGKPPGKTHTHTYIKN